MLGFVAGVLEEPFDFGLLVLLVETLVSLLPDTLGHNGSLRPVGFTDHLGKRLEDLRSTEKPIFNAFVSFLLERFRRLLVILRLGNIRVRGPHGHAPDLDITLKPVNFRGVVHVTEPGLLVDEALGRIKRNIDRLNSWLKRYDSASELTQPRKNLQALLIVRTRVRALFCVSL